MSVVMHKVMTVAGLAKCYENLVVELRQSSEFFAGKSALRWAWIFHEEPQNDKKATNY